MHTYLILMKFQYAEQHEYFKSEINAYLILPEKQLFKSFTF